MSVVDQGFGIGILTLEASSSNRPGVSDGSGDGGNNDDDGSGSIDQAMPLRLPIRVTPPMVRTQVTLPMSQTMTRQRMMQTRVMPKRGIAHSSEDGDDASDADEGVTTIDEGEGGCAGTQGASVLSLALGLIFLMRARRTARGSKPSTVLILY